MANDNFAQIAQSFDASLKEGLIYPAPPKLDKNNIIGLKKADKPLFEPVKKIDTEDELKTELAEMRRKYEPFLQNYAPQIKQYVIRDYINTFDYSLDGGSTQQVKIPHYGGPTGRHTAVYKSTFTLQNFNGKCAMLCFNGVDYIAEVFVNGFFAGRHEGFFAAFEFDITDIAKQGQNSLEVHVKNDFIMMGNANLGEKVTGDKIYAATGPGWDDPEIGWHHCPPGMGILDSVYTEVRPRQYISDIFVRNENEVWLECYNHDISALEIEFSLSVFGQNFEESVYQNYRIAPQTNIEAGVGDTLTEAKLIASGMLNKPTPLKLEGGYNRFILPLKLKNPRLWQPQSPWLYQIQAALLINGSPVFEKAQHFGIRTFTQNLQEEPKGMFYLNGNKTRLRGANTMGFEQQDVMRGDFEQLIDDILLAKLCNMNFLRLTQRPVQKEIYEYCDKLGLMLQTDLPLFGTIRINQFAETVRQAGEMERHVRKYPSCVLVSYINEPFPNSNNMPQRMLTRAEMQQFFAAADTLVKLNNPDRVIKHVDGDYDPPNELMPDNHCYCMWYNGHGIDVGRLHKGHWLAVKPGWYYGCGEFGAEGLDFANVMQECYPEEWLKEPFNPNNIIGAQTGNFHSFFYETPQSMEEWVSESHRHQSRATKIMTSAFRRDNLMSSFAIHLFIDAWPAGWMKTIMDCRRRPKPAYFTYRDCLEPVFCSLRSDRQSFFAGEKICVESYVSNDGDAFEANVMYMAEFNGKIIAAASQHKKISACGSDFCGFIELETPSINERAELNIYMAVQSGQQVLHWAKESYAVFPQIKKVKAPCQISYEEYATHRQKHDKHVAAGGLLVFAPLAAGQYDICGQKIAVKPCSMGSVYFASRNSGHKLVEGFAPTDFEHWYDENEDMIMPLAHATLGGGQMQGILLSSNQTEDGNWQPEPICAEIKHGAGTVLLCQTELGTKMKNPVCAEFVNNINNLYGKA